MIIHFPCKQNKKLIAANYKAAERFYNIVINYFTITDPKDQHWFRWAQSWVDHATSQMLRIA